MMIRTAVLGMFFALMLTALAGVGVCIDEDDAYFEPEKDDFLQIQIVDGRVLALRNKKPSAPVALDFGEEVLMTEEEGRMGAVVTDERLLAVSTASGDWQSEPLEFGEAEAAELMVGENVVLLLTNERILGFGGAENRFAAFDLALYDRPVAYDVGKNIGVVVLPDRAVGFSAATGRFSEIEFFVDSFDFLEVAATLALVHTDDSIHIYHASTGTWSTRSNSGR